MSFHNLVIDEIINIDKEFGEYSCEIYDLITVKCSIKKQDINISIEKAKKNPEYNKR